MVRNAFGPTLPLWKGRHLNVVSIMRKEEIFGAVKAGISRIGSLTRKHLSPQQEASGGKKP